jgi:hypothetical protein
MVAVCDGGALSWAGEVVETRVRLDVAGGEEQMCTWWFMP